MHISDEDAQSITIQSYDANAEEYLSKVGADDARTVAYWPGVEFFLNRLPKERIFEIGSGSGKDALMIEERGHTILRSDATEAFVRHLRESGHEVVSYDVLAGPTNDKQHAIFANAVFLHFTLEQFCTALANVHESLVNNGLFCLGMKLGNFEGWREKGLGDKRYFKFWQTDSLQTELKKAGFSVLKSYTTPANDFVIITSERI